MSELREGISFRRSTDRCSCINGPDSLWIRGKATYENTGELVNSSSGKIQPTVLENFLDQCGRSTH